MSQSALFYCYIGDRQAERANPKSGMENVTYLTLSVDLFAAPASAGVINYSFCCCNLNFTLLHFKAMWLLMQSGFFKWNCNVQQAKLVCTRG